MLILWIIINQADHYCPIIICLVGVELHLKANIVFVFICIIAIMNLMVVVKFFDITYKTILLFLFGSELYDGGLLRPVLMNFGTIKTNDCNILYLHYFVWLKEASHLLILCKKIQENIKFCMKLLAFLEYIIKCYLKNDVFSNALYHTYPDARETNITKNFIAQFKKNNKAIPKKFKCIF